MTSLRIACLTAQQENNRASSLTNFFRNWGGSFGIALITTVAERRQQFHQTNVGSAIAATSQQVTRAPTYASRSKREQVRPGLL